MVTIYTYEWSGTLFGEKSKVIKKSGIEIKIIYMKN